MTASYIIKKKDSKGIIVIREVFDKSQAEDIVMTLRASIKTDEQTTIYYTVRIL